MYRHNKINQKKFTKKTILVSMVLVIAIVGLLAYVLRPHSNASVSKHTSTGAPYAVNYSPPTQADRQQVEQNKVTDIDTKTPPPAPTGTATPASGSTVLILSASQSSKKDLIVKTQLNGSGWKYCTLTLRSDKKTITHDADALYQSSFSTCLGYSIPSTELVAGNWTLQITAYQTDGTKVNSDVKNIIIE